MAWWACFPETPSPLALGNSAPPATPSSRTLLGHMLRLQPPPCRMFRSTLVPRFSWSPLSPQRISPMAVSSLLCTPSSLSYYCFYRCFLLILLILVVVRKHHSFLQLSGRRLLEIPVLLLPHKNKKRKRNWTGRMSSD